MLAAFPVTVAESSIDCAIMLLTAATACPGDSAALALEPADEFPNPSAAVPRLAELAALGPIAVAIGDGARLVLSCNFGSCNSVFGAHAEPVATFIGCSTGSGFVHRA